MKRFASAIILAGGKSSRMGFDKQKVHIGGISMVNYIAKQLEEVFDHIIIVSNKPEYYSPTKYQIVEDNYKDKGPMGGIQAGLSNGRSEYVYVLAGDMPLVSSGYIKWMMKQINNQIALSGEETYSCITKIDGQLEPFNGFYHRKCLGDIQECIMLDHLKITRLLEERDCLILSESVAVKFSPALDMFMNLNTIDKLNNCGKLKESITIIA